jgi:WD40 repeat protein/Flp pilus assembly protein TadD
VPKITDFGLAKQLDREKGQTQSGSILGTPSYMAPEQASGKTKAIGPAADVYALGAILYECLTGRPPFKAATPLDTILQVVSQEPVPPSRLQPKVPRDLETVCLKCLQKEPAKRYASARDLADDLRRFLGGEPIRARPIGLPARVWRWCRRKPAAATLLALAAAVVLGIVLGLPAVAWREQRLRRQAEAKEGEALAAHEQAVQVSRELEQERNGLLLRNVPLARREWDVNNLGAANALLDRCPPEFRGWDWHYVRRLCQSELETLQVRNPDQSRPRITGLAYSPDGRLLAWAAGDGRVAVWDRTARRLVFDVTARPPQGNDENRELYGVALSPDGRLLAAGTGPDGVTVWDLATRKERHTLRGHTGVVLSVAFSPDGRLLASGSRDRTVKLWPLAGGGPLTLTGHGNRVNSLAFSPDGTRLASADLDSLKVWDTRTGQSLFTRRGSAVTVAYSPDGRFVAAADWTGAAVKVWDAKTGRELHTLLGHEKFVAGVAFSPDGRQLASCGWLQSVKVWDTATWREAFGERGHFSTVLSLAYSPDARELASGDWHGVIKSWDATAAPEARTVRLEMPAVAAALAPDGQRLALAVGWGGQVRFWNPTTGVEDVSLPFTGQAVWGFAFSPDGKTLATANHDKVVRLWDAATGERLRELAGHTDAVLKVAYRPDGRLLASAGLDHTVRLWDPATGRLLRTLEGHPSAVNAVAYRPDGARLASGGDDGKVRLWDPEDGRELSALELPGGKVTALAYSPDGTRLAAAGAENVLRLWDAATDRELLTLTGHTYGVAGIAFSPDGRRLASAGGDGILKVWDAATGVEVLNLRQHNDSLTTVLFSPDGHRLVSVGEDRTVRIWDAELLAPEARRERLVKQARAWHQHEAAAAERARQWFAAVFHLDRLLAAAPDDAALLRSRAAAHAELGHYPQADADLTRAAKSRPFDVEVQGMQAMVRLASGDRALYRAACGSLLAGTAFSPNVDLSAMAVGMGTLAPGAVDDPAVLVRRAEGLLKKAPDSYVVRAMYGAALYRAGRWAEAVEQLHKAMELHGQDGIAWDWLFLAMAHHRLGQDKEARSWMDKVVNGPGDATHEAPLDIPNYNGPAWIPRLAVRILRQEAEAMLPAAGSGPGDRR